MSSVSAQLRWAVEQIKREQRARAESGEIDKRRWLVTAIFSIEDVIRELESPTEARQPQLQGIIHTPARILGRPVVVSEEMKTPEITFVK